MHYDYFDFQHTMTDAERSRWLREQYELILARVSDGSGRKINRLLKFLRESDFYTVPSRHHAFVGGNAWHQLETLAYAFEPLPPSASPELQEWQRRWQAEDRMSVAVVCLLHDICNAGYGGSIKVDYPQRIRPRHGRKSTYVLIDFLKFDLMFDENMAIIHHHHVTDEELRLHTLTDEDASRVWDMPLYRMVVYCNQQSADSRMTERQLQSSVQSVLQSL